MSRGKRCLSLSRRRREAQHALAAPEASTLELHANLAPTLDGIGAEGASGRPSPVSPLELRAPSAAAPSTASLRPSSTSPLEAPSTANLAPCPICGKDMQSLSGAARDSHVNQHFDGPAQAQAPHEAAPACSSLLAYSTRGSARSAVGRCSSTHAQSAAQWRWLPSGSGCVADRTQPRNALSVLMANAANVWRREPAPSPAPAPKSTDAFAALMSGARELARTPLQKPAQQPLPAGRGRGRGRGGGRSMWGGGQTRQVPLCHRVAGTELAGTFVVDAFNCAPPA
ncbi:hypothetical protein T492DRAFT_870179, partial [Pavlovales sp. CCMP2436]